MTEQNISWVKRAGLVVLFLATFIGFNHLAVGQITSDGVTPANEGICDSLQTATKGLFGLCVAYCEAQDLDMIDKAPPNLKILENYRKKMQVGDLDMPCVKCVVGAELNAMTADGSVALCNRIGDKIRIDDDNGGMNFADVDTTAGRERCRFIDADTVPPTVRIHWIARDKDLTVTAAERAKMYYDAIDATCQSVGK